MYEFIHGILNDIILYVSIILAAGVVLGIGIFVLVQKVLRRK